MNCSLRFDIHEIGGLPPLTIASAVVRSREVVYPHVQWKSACHTQYPSSSRSCVLLARLLPWLFVLMGGVCLYYGNQELPSAQSMADWARTEGQIISLPAERTQHGTSLSYHALIVYEYRSEGMVFHRTRLSLADHPFRRAAEVQAVVNRYPVGRTATVYYNPFNATKSMPEPGSPWQPYVVLATGGLCILVGLCLAVCMRRLMRREN